MQTIALHETHYPYTVTVDEQSLQNDGSVLEQNGQPLAVLLPIAEYEAYRTWQRRQPRRHQASHTAFAQERAAFERMLPQLVQAYPHRVVAVYQGKVVEVGDDVGETLASVHARYGYVVCYVGRVELSGRVYKFPYRRVVR